MDALLGGLSSLANLLLVVLAFGAIIFVHELGHFLAARWAGIRVLAFAIGFGPAACSYRKGLGLRRGDTSSEVERLRALASGEGEAADRARAKLDGLSPTEYRLNWLPLGGYVKMLGQEDLDPGAVSDAPDSYQNRPPWRRMVVISAGVIMNVITAAILFIIVFAIGLPVNPPVLGGVEVDSPAARSVASNAPEGLEPGLMAGDRVIEVNGHRPNRFDQIFQELWLADPGRPVEFVVERSGVDEPLRFSIESQRDEERGLISIGRLDPPSSPVIAPIPDGGIPPGFEPLFQDLDERGIEPGARLIAIDGDPVGEDAFDVGYRLRRAFIGSEGGSVLLSFRNPSGSQVQSAYEPRPQFESARVAGVAATAQHLLGLMSPMQVTAVARDGLSVEPGDVFVRLAGRVFPAVPDAQLAIRAARGDEIEVAVLRGDEAPRTLSFTETVSSGGQLGISYARMDEAKSIVALSGQPLLEAEVNEAADEQGARGPLDARLVELPGTRIVAVGGRPTETFADVRAGLRDAIAAARGDVATGGEGGELSIPVQLELPRTEAQRAAGDPATVYEDRWVLTAAQADRVMRLGWHEPDLLLTIDERPLRAAHPFDAVAIGLGETRYVMIRTYLTIVRLFQGSVAVSNLHGPVGIAALGTRVADRGLVWLMFFMALISINLAVINFLPLPIVDGGHFVMLVYEQIVGRPVPLAVQGVITIAGLVLIGAMFLFVTFNDIARLLGGG